MEMIIFDPLYNQTKRYRSYQKVYVTCNHSEDRTVIEDIRSYNRHDMNVFGMLGVSYITGFSETDKTIDMSFTLKYKEHGRDSPFFTSWYNAGAVRPVISRGFRSDYRSTSEDITMRILRRGMPFVQFKIMEYSITYNSEPALPRSERPSNGIVQRISEHFQERPNEQLQERANDHLRERSREHFQEIMRERMHDSIDLQRAIQRQEHRDRHWDEHIRRERQLDEHIRRERQWDEHIRRERLESNCEDNMVDRYTTGFSRVGTHLEPFHDLERFHKQTVVDSESRTENTNGIIHNREGRIDDLLRSQNMLSDDEEIRPSNNLRNEYGSRSHRANQVIEMEAAEERFEMQRRERSERQTILARRIIEDMNAMPDIEVTEEITREEGMTIERGTFVRTDETGRAYEVSPNRNDGHPTFQPLLPEEQNALSGLRQSIQRITSDPPILQGFANIFGNGAAFFLQDLAIPFIEIISHQMIARATRLQPHEESDIQRMDLSKWLQERLWKIQNSGILEVRTEQKERLYPIMSSIEETIEQISPSLRNRHGFDLIQIQSQYMINRVFENIRRQENMDRTFESMDTGFCRFPSRYVSVTDPIQEMVSISQEKTYYCLTFSSTEDVQGVDGEDLEKHF